VCFTFGKPPDIQEQPAVLTGASLAQTASMRLSHYRQFLGYIWDIEIRAKYAGE